MTETTKQYLTLEELKQTKEFEHLSPKMGAWVLAYVQHYLDTGIFDPQFATRAAYTCKPESVRRIGNEMLSTPRVLFAINRFLGDTPEEIFRKTVERAKYNRKLTTAQVQVLRLECEVNGYGCANWPKRNDSKPKDAEPEAAAKNETADTVIYPARFIVGEIAILDGRQYRVTAVKDDGTVSEADPL